MKSVFAPSVFRSRAFAGGAMAGVGPAVIVPPRPVPVIYLRRPERATIVLHGLGRGGLLLETEEGYVLVSEDVAFLLGPRDKVIPSITLTRSEIPTIELRWPSPD